MNTKTSSNNTKNIPSRASTPTTDYDSSSVASSLWESTPILEPHTDRKTVLVTGGAGFIGSNVARALLQRGDHVVIIDEMNSYYDTTIKETNLQLLRQEFGDSVLHIYQGDICDKELVQGIFEKHRPEWVCHMAARAGVRPSIEDPYVYIHSNIEGTTRLMELSAKYGVKNFVFASSSSVYGGSTSTFFSEDEVVDNPVSPYAASKKACELLAYTYHHLYKLNVTGLRFFTVYGPRGRPDMAPFKFIDRVSRGQEIQQFGDGSSSRDYTYIDDIVDGVVRAVDRPYPYQIFNLGKGSGTSLKEFIDLVQECVGKKALIKVLPDQPGDVPYTCADVSKAARLLGYESKVTFEEGIRRTVEWYQSAYGDAVVVSLVNKVVPFLMGIFAVHGFVCAGEGILLGQKDLAFLGRMYAAFFAVVPYLMLRVKKAAITGSKAVDLTSVWKIFLTYQLFRAASWVSRVAFLQRRTEAKANQL